MEQRKELLQMVLEGRRRNDEELAEAGWQIRGKEIHICGRRGVHRALMYSVAEKKAPVYIHVHGGGFIYGGPEYEDRYCDYINQKVNCTVFNLEYRLAPEFPFPAGVEDVYDAVCEILDKAEEYQIDIGKVIIGGDSAGATLVVDACYLLKKYRNYKPTAQVLLYPFLDSETPAEQKFYMEGVIPIERSNLYNSCYRKEEEATDVLCSPILLSTEQLQNMPDTYLMTCEIDSLRDEGEQFAMNLMKTGVEVTGKRIRGKQHGFLMKNIDNALDFYEQISKWMLFKFQ